MMITSDEFDCTEVLKKSQELDELILQAMKIMNYCKAVLGDNHMREFDLILDKLQLFEKMYHSIRIVDPIRKKVLELKEEEIRELDLPCYDFWQRGTVCENCISMRAYNENDSIFKIERKGTSIYLVIAVPVVIMERKIVIELFKNVTNSLYLGTREPGNIAKAFSTIEYMNQAAVKDVLTDLYNRRYINERLPVDLLNASIRNEPLSIIFADLDHFKAVNDTYGHSAGDQVLQQCAEELRKYTRSEKDWIARYGGEEFMICLAGTEEETARMVAERIRKSIMQKDFIVGDERIKLTCSFGVHTVHNVNECPTVEALIELADKKLYQAKIQGRNKVI